MGFEHRYLIEVDKTSLDICGIKRLKYLNVDKKMQYLTNPNIGELRSRLEIHQLNEINIHI